VLANAIDLVEQAPDKKKAFQNFITAFEAIVAYHKASEKK
jgi:CRISPR type III-A-associated protein Csm2